MPSKELVSGTHHFGCRVEHLHLLQDGGAVAGNNNVTFLILDLKNRGFKDVSGVLEFECIRLKRYSVY